VKITILTTGGTIDKTYDEYGGNLEIEGTNLDEILASLRLPDLFIRHVSVMRKDSLDMTEEDRGTILRAVQNALTTSDAVIVVHGTTPWARPATTCTPGSTSSRSPSS